MPVPLTGVDQSVQLEAQEKAHSFGVWGIFWLVCLVANGIAVGQLWIDSNGLELKQCMRQILAAVFTLTSGFIVWRRSRNIAAEPSRNGLVSLVLFSPWLLALLFSTSIAFTLPLISVFWDRSPGRR